MPKYEVRVNRITTSQAVFTMDANNEDEIYLNIEEIAEKKNIDFDELIAVDYDIEEIIETEED